MMRWILRLYPRSFRRRYEDELNELLDDSSRPVRDNLDIALHAGHLRWQQLMTNIVRHVANVGVAVALFLLGYAVNDLQDGVAEIGQHWWSTGAVLLVVAAATIRVTIAVATAKRPPTAPSAPRS